MSDPSWPARRLVALLCFVLAFWWAKDARADPDVVLAVAVEGEGKDVGAKELEVRVRRELEGRGFGVGVLQERPAFDESRFSWLRRQTTDADAALGVFLWVRADTGYAELLVLDRVTGKSLVRNIPPAEAGAPVASTVALAAAELVEASLIEIQMPHETMQAEVKPPPSLPMPVLEAAPEPFWRWQAEVRAGGLWPVRLPNPLAVTRVSIGVRPHERILVELPATLPLHPVADALDDAAIRTLVFAFGVGLRADLLPARAPVQLELRGGGSIAPIRIDVDAPAELNPRPRTFWTGMGNAGLAVRKEWGHVYLVVDAGADIPVVAPRVTAGGALVHDLGGAWPRVDVGVGGRW